MSTPPSPGRRPLEPTANLDHGPTSDVSGRPGRGLVPWLAVVAVGLVAAGAGLLLDGLPTVLAAVLAVGGLLVVVIGCLVVGRRGTPGSGGGFSALG
ncbi:hypothetical protein GCM10023340_41180 [Nocardioides marinquilinus]|uniref:DUF3040 domain-containing protein n=1 Tax=Nocardioides marinquilinus TaxID=1210400 RepID=A0ABP9Q1J0_9ACTN